MLEALRKNAIAGSVNDPDNAEIYINAMEKLVCSVQELSHARTLEEIIRIVRLAARELTGADGATFVLKDREHCYYVEENAIAPLWKGKRFPLETCISGWVMNHKQAACIEDIYTDPRIPAEAYQPTFVKSLVMVPVRRQNPVAAIGNYWATKRLPSDFEVALLQALADSTSVAMENVTLYNDLQRKIKALQESNDELSHFSWVVSHDLKEPLRTIKTHADILTEKFGTKLGDKATMHLNVISRGTDRLQALIKDLLIHASIFRSSQFSAVDTKKLIDEIVDEDLQVMIKETRAKIEYGDMPVIWGNAASISRLLQNLICNAIKFVDGKTRPHVKITCDREFDSYRFAVTDNGIGIEHEYHQRIFDMFARQHSQDEYPGSGIGLATCKKVVELHGGNIWVESEPHKGSTFLFTLVPSHESGGR